MTGNVKIVGGAANTRFCFKDTPFTRCVLHLNDTHVEIAENLKSVIKHYNMIEYSFNHQETVGSLYQFKRDEQALVGQNVLDSVNVDNSSSFRYKLSLLTGLDSEEGGAGAGAYSIFKND